jgi:hypothetical protein
MRSPLHFVTPEPTTQFQLLEEGNVTTLFSDRGLTMPAKLDRMTSKKYNYRHFSECWR